MTFWLLFKFSISRFISRMVSLQFLRLRPLPSSLNTASLSGYGSSCTSLLWSEAIAALGMEL